MEIKETEKTAAEILTEQHQKAVVLAEKIDKAAYTADRINELEEFVGVSYRIAPFTLALYAANKILNGANGPIWIK